MLDALIDKIGNGLLQLLGLAALGAIALAAVWLKRKITDLLTKHMVVEEIQNGQKITELLVEIRLACKADRVSIYLFHNGEHYINGSSILRISGAYETVAAGIATQRGNTQNVLISTVPEAVAFLVKPRPKDAVAMTHTSELEPGFYRAALEAQGVRAVAKYPLYKASDIIGFICADFVQKDVQEDHGDLDIIKTHAPRLELYLHETKKVSLWRKLFGARK